MPCPACGKPSPADALTCPHCGISLHPDAPTRARSDKPGGLSSVLIAIVVGGAILAFVLVLLVGVGLFTFRSSAVHIVPTPAGSTISVPAGTATAVEEPAEPAKTVETLPADVEKQPSNEVETKP